VWARVLAQVIDDAHLVSGDQLSAMVDAAVHDLGWSARLWLADLSQQGLHQIAAHKVMTIEIDGTLPGRAYQRGEIFYGQDDRARLVAWVPMLDGTDRVGLLQITVLDAPAEQELDQPARDGQARLWWTLAGLMGHVVITKLVHSDRLRRLRTAGPMQPSAELMWQLLPPRTFANRAVVVTALLEPASGVAGDAYDYEVDSDAVTLAVFDGVGHDIQSGLTTAVAVSAIRAARQEGHKGLSFLANRADALIAAQPDGSRFVTAVLAHLETATGTLDYLIAGHPPPLLLRGNRIVKHLTGKCRVPLGIGGKFPDAPVGEVVREQLEPGDRVLFYSDGITEARDSTGEFFGEQRLVYCTERASLDRLSAPETLRRLVADVAAHQDGQFRDDATLLMCDWSTTGYQLMAPSFLDGH
jgi:hypothetical protein